MSFLDIGEQGKKDLSELIRTLKPEEVWDRVFKRLDRLGAKLAGIVIKESLSGQRLNRRTGALARSVIGRAIRVNGVPAIRVGIFRGPSLAYAGIQETGGIIKPKKAKALAIPVNDALTPAGVSRYGSPRNYPGKLRFIPFRRGVAIGALVDDSQAKVAELAGTFSLDTVKPLYILATQVKIPASEWLSKPVMDNLPLIAQELADYFRQELLSVR